MKETLFRLENKYQTIENSFQTLIIESSDHNGDFSNYSYDYCRKLLAYAVSKLFLMEKSGKYESVAMFKNFGELSGGSLRHPHMQIVGFENENIYSSISKQNFKGICVQQSSCGSAEVNISLHPIMGFC